MGFLARLKGEEPGLIESLLHYENVGQFGEYSVNYALSHDNLPGYSKTLVNVYLPSKGHTTELDVLMVHEKGVFVFESKNYSGWIFGSADQQKWTQCLRNGERHQFYNPLKQNKTHCQALAEFLNVPASCVSSYIIFSNRCELKQIPENSEQYKIVQRDHLLRMLRKDLESKPVLYSHANVDEMAAKLSTGADKSDVEKAQHIHEIQERTEGSVCPFCGNALVLRKGQYGQFYGCSKYPKCKFTRKV